VTAPPPSVSSVNMKGEVFAPPSASSVIMTGGVFPRSLMSERQGNLLRFKVPNTGAKLADLFRAIELAKVRTGVEFVASLGQTTLENIFVAFAAEQAEEIARGKKEKTQ
jgi:hypothetical protein